jgi:uncharacterized damage-inducible protein DinB
MNYQIEQAIEILEQTPDTLSNLLGNLSNDWIRNNEGNNTWNPFDIVGHLIHGEETDWITRTKIILNNKGDKKFQPFDRFAQNERFKDKSLQELLMLFKNLRKKNIRFIKQLELEESMLEKTGVHPEFGEVKLRELLATWVVHDLNHIGQIVRVISKQYSNEVGPFKKYLPILNH